MLKKKADVSLIFKIILVLLLIFSAYIIYENVKVKNFTRKSVDFEQTLNEVFLRCGLKVHQIVLSFQIEERKDGFRWIKFTKKIEVEASRLDYFVKNIKEAALRKKLKIYTFERDVDGARLKIGLRNIILSDIQFQLAPRKNLLAIIVDDIGYTKNIKGFVELDIVLTYAILPGLPHSGFFARKFQADGTPYILHMPMEPQGYPEIDPGEIYLAIRMNKKEVSDIFKKALKSVAGVKGISNHMGSRFTSDSQAMESFLSIVKKERLFFIDSATSGDSVGYKMASHKDIPTAENNFFIDNIDDFNHIIERLKLLKKIALSRSKTVAICHITKKNTPLALKEYIPKMKEAGIKFVSVSDILDK